MEVEVEIEGLGKMIVAVVDGRKFIFLFLRRKSFI